jgi:hypothetical protein
MNWLLAIGVRFFCIAGSTEGRARSLCSAIGLSLMALNLLMLAFYNHHLNYYANYGEMLCRLAQLFWERYFFCRPVRIMPWLAVPPMLCAIYFILHALFVDALTPKAM